jgi:hypothetical protein
MTGPARLDLHVHSEHSPDSWLRLEEIAVRALAVGLEGFALTDHNTVAGHEALASLRSRFPRLLVIPGVEVSTTDGHLLVYGVREVPPVHRPLIETIEWVRDHGGEPVLAHPLRRWHGVGRKASESAPVNALEVRNGHNSETANRLASAIAHRRGLGSTGGSDAHGLGDIGRAFTEFPANATTPDALIEAIRAHRTVAGGRSLTGAEHLRLAARTAFLRLARGLRSI